MLTQLELTSGKNWIRMATRFFIRQFLSKNTPSKTFIARRNSKGKWVEWSYERSYERVRHIAQSLLKRKLSLKKPIAILSENSVEHALLALAALHVGIPFSPIAPAYSLKSTDFNRLKFVIDQLKPGLIFAGDGKKYGKAIQAISKGIEVVIHENHNDQLGSCSFDDFEKTPVTDDVDSAYQSIRPETVAKILFTSGSTALPKGVINTHENLCANLQQITQTFPFLRDEGLEFIDWLPWNHVFGGNHNFGLTIYNGGTLYIDDGNPTPEGVPETVRNLQERNPTIYFNVPKGFESLIPFFKVDQELREHFFSKLKMLFYAGAGMPQHVWDAWEELAVETIGKKIIIATGLGCTESSPSALFASEPRGFAGLLGVPVPGLELKLVPTGNKLEARYRGKNIFPGYWKREDLTSICFDEDGFYCTGDALKFVDPEDVNKGMVFDGRFAEDFKLSTGTWVRVGLLRAQLIAAGNGLIQDVIITGHDQNFVGAIIFPGIEQCRKLTETVTVTGRGTVSANHPEALIQDIRVREEIKKILDDFAGRATGSASLIRRGILALLDLSIDKGEITDKGTINQQMVIMNHQELIDKIYSEPAGEEIIEIEMNS